ncbi:hypothetical protein PybrP1_003332 [[Pythium] brassicae (nom. inval.)]|nr:hypothetical protein PybrP1_003332 [[Pythium] brassicae (nom. inval.)]
MTGGSGRAPPSWSSSHSSRPPRPRHSRASSVGSSSAARRVGVHTAPHCRLPTFARLDTGCERSRSMAALLLHGRLLRGERPDRYDAARVAEAHDGVRQGKRHASPGARELVRAFNEPLASKRLPLSPMYGFFLTCFFFHRDEERIVVQEDGVAHEVVRLELA